jgi:hypothetical protein
MTRRACGEQTTAAASGSTDPLEALRAETRWGETRPLGRAGDAVGSGHAVEDLAD